MLGNGAEDKENFSPFLLDPIVIHACERGDWLTIGVRTTIIYEIFRSENEQKEN